MMASDIDKFRSENCGWMSSNTITTKSINEVDTPSCYSKKIIAVRLIARPTFHQLIIADSFSLRFLIDFCLRRTRLIEPV